MLLFLWKSADAVQKAEEAKTQWIHREFDISHVAQSVAQESRKLFAPRLVVVRGPDSDLAADR